LNWQINARKGISEILNYLRQKPADFQFAIRMVTQVRQEVRRQNLMQEWTPGDPQPMINEKASLVGGQLDRAAESLSRSNLPQGLKHLEAALKMLEL
jgi:hypothetical protein